MEKIIKENLKVHESIEDRDSTNISTKIMKPSFFPPANPEEMREKYNIHYCMRLMPHDQNTGGFFIALFRKKSKIVWLSRKDVKIKEEKT